MREKEVEFNRNLRLSFFIMLIFGMLFIILLTNQISAQEALYCAEKTTGGAWCQNVPQSECDTGTNPITNQAYKCDRTSCESTSYCSIGTCANTQAGNCLPSPQATCDPSQGGFFYNQPKDEVAQCQVGCCLLGEGSSLVERVRCDVQGADYNLRAEFRADITDEVLCLSLASPKEKGACVFEMERGRDCKFITREGCQTSSGEFHRGFLCTAPELGTLCAKTKRTTCISGRNDVYFVDSCGNTANIYDANKVDDIAYWSFVPGVEGVEVDLGDGKGNIDSSIYGACSYFDGSTCGDGNARFGNNICVDLGCSASELTGGIRREHGESWCSEPLSNFENAKPGQLSTLIYCSNGEVQYEVGDNFRNKLCLEDGDGFAGWIVNEWAMCFLQDNTRDCENLDYCKVLQSEGIFPTSYGDPSRQLIEDSDTKEKIKASCVPKYSPGFKFWDPEGTIADIEGEIQTPISVCEFSSVVCVVPYTEEIIFLGWDKDPDPNCLALCEQEGGEDCKDVCTPVCLETPPSDTTPINREWAENVQNVCVVLGDCGVSSNYLRREGYNRWRDLFEGGQIDWNTLPRAENKK